jgi:hypothetical protein
VLRGIYLIVLLCLVIVVVGAQTPRPAAKQTFTSPAGTYRFDYPETYRLYTGSEGYEAASKLSYLPVCQSGIATCVIFPPSKYKGTNFDGASFQVRQIEDAITAQECLTPRVIGPSEKDYSIAAKDSRKDIDGTRFVHGIKDGVGLGHSATTDLYRTFHEHRCYELSITLTTTEYANFDPATIKEFTKVDEQRVYKALAAILNSFRFLK